MPRRTRYLGSLKRARKCTSTPANTSGTPMMTSTISTAKSGSMRPYRSESHRSCAPPGQRSQSQYGERPAQASAAQSAASEGETDRRVGGDDADAVLELDAVEEGHGRVDHAVV